jgi:8-oxo-dGTP pyrophosphatase MutT (NUDIX family)
MKKGKVYGGVLLICGEKFLLGQRGKDGSFPNCWSVFGGKIEEGPFEEQWDMGYPYHLYLGYCNEEYECKLNEENQDWGWFDLNDLPKPLFPTLFASLTRIF